MAWTPDWAAAGTLVAPETPEPQAVTMPEAGVAPAAGALKASAPPITAVTTAVGAMRERDRDMVGFLPDGTRCDGAVVADRVPPSRR
jgi:hypothetical protein